MKRKKSLQRVCMLSVHGYVSPKPILGKTDTGGQVTYVMDLSRALALKNIKVDIYTRRFQHKKTIERVGKNVRIIRIPAGGEKFIPKERLFPYLGTFARNMVRFIKAENLEYDIYHSHYWDAGYVASKVTAKLKTFYVHTFHSLGAWKKIHMGGDPRQMEKIYRYKERIKHEKIIMRKCKGLVMTSPAMVKFCRELYGYKGNNHTVLPAGVNMDIYRPLERKEKEKRIDVPQNYFFWVGRFAANKGLDYLLRAFSEIMRKAKDLFCVIGGGSKRPTREEIKLKQLLRKILESTGIKNRVFFTGHIKNGLLPSYYRRAKFFVLPSKFEPFGMAAAEAMACGTAVIISKRAGIKRYLKNGYDSLMVDSTNKKALAWALQVLNRNNSFRAKIVRNGLKTAQEKFNWPDITRKLISFYENLS